MPIVWRTRNRRRVIAEKVPLAVYVHVESQQPDTPCAELQGEIDRRKARIIAIVYAPGSKTKAMLGASVDQIEVKLARGLGFVVVVPRRLVVRTPFLAVKLARLRRRGSPPLGVRCIQYVSPRRQLPRIVNDNYRTFEPSRGLDLAFCEARAGRYDNSFLPFFLAERFFLRGFRLLTVLVSSFDRTSLPIPAASARRACSAGISSGTR